MKKTLWLLLMLELAYWVPARLLNLYYQGGEVEKELIWTAFRLISVAAVYGCFRKVIWPAGDESRGSGWGLAVGAGAAVVIAGALVGDMGLTYPANWVFAATSLAVGLREEMVYRGVLQRVLTERYGLWAALLGSNVIFIIYHLGAVSFTPYEVFQFFAMGMILGLMYHRTKSLLLVAGVHAAYDAGQCFTPVLEPPLSAWWAVAVMLPVLGVLAGRATRNDATS